MANILRDDPKHWRDLAEQARVRAEQMADPASRQMLLSIAQTYENLARQAEKRLRDAENSK
jgi:DNA-binding ferritin-like protein